jgi:valyl-tRNA synthetase
MEDRWIISRLNQAIAQITSDIGHFEFADSAAVMYRFFWNEFCDWYLEWTKPRMRQGGKTRQQACQVLAFCLDQILRSMHPTMPYITEKIWMYLNEVYPQRMLEKELPVGNSLATSAWPESHENRNDAEVEKDMELLQNLIRAGRDVRTSVNRIRSADKQSSLNKLPFALVRASESLLELFRGAQEIIGELGYLEKIDLQTSAAIPAGSSVKVITDAAGQTIELIVPLAELIDIEQERKRLTKELAELEGHIKNSEGRLSNENFVRKAPAKVLEEHRQKLDELKAKRESLSQALAELK